MGFGTWQDEEGKEKGKEDKSKKFKDYQKEYYEQLGYKLAADAFIRAAEEEEDRQAFEYRKFLHDKECIRKEDEKIVSLSKK